MPPSGRGVVLVAVLVVAALVAIIAAGLMFRMRAEVAATAAVGRGEQAYEAATSGIVRAVVVLKASGGDMSIWYDNPDLFQNQLVADDGANRWYFTVYGDNADVQQPTPRFGLTDEAGKINPNSATPEMLLALPNMSAELVDCLVDYRDADAETRPDGAEQDYYDQLESPYAIPNGPLSTVEELLLVKGFNAEIVYGEDANMNGILDPNEDDGDETFPPDNHDGRLDRGLRGVATVVSNEPNVDSAGRPRININTGSQGKTSGSPDASGGGEDAGGAADSQGGAISGVPAKLAEFIRLYRGDGGTFKHPSELLEMRYQLKNQPKDAPGLKPGSWIESGVGAAELPMVLDRLTTQPTGKNKPLVGLVNANTAPLEVLAALPGMDANLAQQIVDARSELDAETKASVAWLYTQGLLDADAFKKVAPYLTARSFQYSVRCVGFGVPCGRFRVVEAVIDVSGGTPRVVYTRDISRLGLPFALDAESLERSR
jgi:type II secretory pathway component PulK